jgi:hypothetical protein
MTPAVVKTGEHHDTVEDLIRYAAHAFSRAGVDFRPAKMSRLIRRSYAAGLAQASIHGYLDSAADRLSWGGFELYVNGYADPTGAHAAKNVDNARTQQINTYN